MESIDFYHHPEVIQPRNWNAGYGYVSAKIKKRNDTDSKEEKRRRKNRCSAVGTNDPASVQISKKNLFIS